MWMTMNALKLYLAIERHGGGLLKEKTLCETTNISHGSFIAARRELCEMKLLAVEQIHRKPCYHLLNPELAAQCIAASAAQDNDWTDY